MTGAPYAGDASQLSGRVDTLSVDRATFFEMIGPLDAIMKRTVQDYGQIVLRSVPILAELPQAHLEALTPVSESALLEAGAREAAHTTIYSRPPRLLQQHSRPYHPTAHD